MNTLKLTFLEVISRGFFAFKPKKIDSFQLEVFRIMISLYALVSLFITLRDYNSLLAPDAIVNWEVSDANCYFFEFHLKRVSDILHLNSTTVLNSFIFLYISALFCLLIGFLPNIASVISFFVQYTFSNMLSSYGYGADIYLSVSLFILLFCPTGYCLSIVKRKSIKEIDTVRFLCIRVLQIYLILTYMSAGFEKALIGNWWTGVFMFSVFSDPSLSKLEMLAPGMNATLFQVIGWLVLLVECLYFILIWIPGIRTIWFIAIVLMHLYISLFLSMPLFGLIMIILNVCCWYPGIRSDYRAWRSLKNNIAS